jgi:hypothetical protein
MDWDKSTLGITYLGSVPLDTVTPPGVNNVVKISRSDYDFEIQIKRINYEVFTGVILGIEPIAEMCSLDFEIGHEVEFSYGNIKSLRR